MHGGAFVQTITMAENYSFFFFFGRCWHLSKVLQKVIFYHKLSWSYVWNLAMLVVPHRPCFLTSHFSMANTLKQTLGKRNWNEPFNFSEVYQTKLCFGQESTWILWTVMHWFILSNMNFSEKAMEAQSPLQVCWSLGSVSVSPQVFWWCSLASTMSFILKVIDTEICSKNVLSWTVGTEGLIPPICSFLTAWQALCRLLFYRGANYLPQCSTAKSS